MYFTQEQYSEMAMTEELAEKIADTYLSNDMSKLKEIINKLIYRKHMPESFNEDLMEIGMDVFIQSIYKYNPNKSEASFKTFLWGNIWRKFWSYKKKITNSCRCDWIPEIDEETKEYKKDKKGEIVHRPLFDISIFSKKDDEDKEIWEFIECKNKIEDELQEIFYDNDTSNDSYSREMQSYLSSLSDLQRKILLMLSEGLKADEIKKELHIENTLYNDSVRAIKNISKTRELRRKYYAGRI